MKFNSIEFIILHELGHLYNLRSQQKLHNAKCRQRYSVIITVLKLISSFAQQLYCTYFPLFSLTCCNPSLGLLLVCLQEEMKCELICVICILPQKESSTAYSLPSLCEFTSLFRYKKAEYCTTLANTQCLLLQHTLTSNQLYLKKKRCKITMCL